MGVPSTITKSRSTSHADRPPTRAVRVPCRRGGHAVECHAQLQGVARHHLTPKAEPVDPPEERQPAAIAVIEQHGDCAELGQRLDHEHTRGGWTARKVAGEELLGPAELPPSLGRVTRHHRGDRRDEEKRRAVRQHVCGLRDLHHAEATDRHATRWRRPPSWPCAAPSSPAAAGGPARLLGGAGPGSRARRAAPSPWPAPGAP